MDNQNPERFSRLTKAALAALSAGGGAAQDYGVCIMPVLADAPPTPLVHPLWGKPSSTWTYRDATGKVLFHVCRFDPPGKRKQFLPLSLWCKDGRLAWRCE
jgi:putative DNA primase/helicase